MNSCAIELETGRGAPLSSSQQTTRVNAFHTNDDKSHHTAQRNGALNQRPELKSRDGASGRVRDLAERGVEKHFRHEEDGGNTPYASENLLQNDGVFLLARHSEGGNAEARDRVFNRQRLLRLLGLLRLVLGTLPSDGTIFHPVNTISQRRPIPPRPTATAARPASPSDRTRQIVQRHERRRGGSEEVVPSRQNCEPVLASS